MIRMRSPRGGNSFATHFGRIEAETIPDRYENAQSLPVGLSGFPLTRYGGCYICSFYVLFGGC